MKNLRGQSPIDVIHTMEHETLSIYLMQRLRQLHEVNMDTYYRFGHYYDKRYDPPEYIHTYAAYASSCELQHETLAHRFRMKTRKEVHVPKEVMNSEGGSWRHKYLPKEFFTHILGDDADVAYVNYPAVYRFSSSSVPDAARFEDADEDEGGPTKPTGREEGTTAVSKDKNVEKAGKGNKKEKGKEKEKEKENETSKEKKREEEAAAKAIVKKKKKKTETKVPVIEAFPELAPKDFYERQRLLRMRGRGRGYVGRGGRGRGRGRGVVGRGGRGRGLIEFVSAMEDGKDEEKSDKELTKAMLRKLALSNKNFPRLPQRKQRRGGGRGGRGRSSNEGRAVRVESRQAWKKEKGKEKEKGEKEKEEEGTKGKEREKEKEKEETQ